MLEILCFALWLVWGLTCFTLFGLLVGPVIWLLTLGLFRFICRMLLRRVGDPDDVLGA